MNVAYSSNLCIDPDKRYSVWRKHPHLPGYSLERSYYGSYFFDEGEYYLDASADEWYVTAEGDVPKVKSTRNKKCPPGQIKRDGYTRKGYTRKDGTRVKGTRVPPACIEDRGEPGKGPDIVPELREGKLGGPGYLKKSATERRKILDRCVKKYGYTSCMRSVQYLLVVGKNEWSKAQLNKVRADLKWIVKKYGKNENPEHDHGGSCCYACSVGAPCETGCDLQPKQTKKETRALKNKLLR